MFYIHYPKFFWGFKINFTNYLIMGQKKKNSLEFFLDIHVADEVLDPPSRWETFCCPEPGGSLTEYTNSCA